jgi:hypothetical protein
MEFFLIREVGCGVQTGSTRHVGHFWPIVPVPGDREDGEFGGIKMNMEHAQVTYSSAGSTNECILCQVQNI